MPEHNTLTGADLHEPKGADTANAGEVYVASGGGSGTWSPVEDVLTVDLDNIDTATSWWVVSPAPGDIVKIQSVIHGAISADNTLTFEIGGVAVTGGTILIASAGSTAGITDECTPSAANTVTAGQAIEIISDGAAAAACRATISITIQRNV